jgi:hypothetical protein
MVQLIAKSKLRRFRETKLKTQYHFDKTNINNLQLPSYIIELDKQTLNNKIIQIVKKYCHNNYIELYREELDDKYDFSDMECLYLFKFYQDGYIMDIPQQNNYFPSWVFTYNLQPLQTKIDVITSKAYDKLEPNLCKWYLNESHHFSVLDVTYLLHYFVMLYNKQKEESTPTNKME